MIILDENTAVYSFLQSETWQIGGGIAFLLILIVFLVYIWYTRNIKNSSSGHMEDVDKRMQRLESQNKIQKIHIEEIECCKNQLLQNQQALAKHNSKLSEVVNEFKLQVVIVAGAVERLKEIQSDPKSETQLQILERSVQAMLWELDSLIAKESDRPINDDIKSSNYSNGVFDTASKDVSVKVPAEVAPVNEDKEKEQDRLTAPIVYSENKSIMIIADKEMQEHVIAIASPQYKVIVANKEQEALDVLKTRSRAIDLIIYDQATKAEEGIRFAEKLKGNALISHIPILMMINEVTPAIQVEAYDAGIDSLMDRSFEAKLFLVRVDNMIESRRNLQRKMNHSVDVSNKKTVEESPDEKFVKKVVDLINKNYTNPDYEVSDFIKDMGVSKSLVNKKMQALLGQSAGQYIRNYRLTIAHEMIINNEDIYISEVALKVGFNDPKYFTRCFTRYFGTAPSLITKDNVGVKSTKHN